MTTHLFSNAFGKFDPTGKRFAISDSRTPTPWVNVVCNGHYGFVVSQNGGGFSWLDNSQLNVLTRWEMDLIREYYPQADIWTVIGTRPISEVTLTIVSLIQDRH